jgi:NTE family protein
MKKNILIFLLLIMAWFSKAQNSVTNSVDNAAPVRIGLCLSGGGALGFAHIGAIKALEEHGIIADEVSGASMGAIVACFYAAGYTPEQLLEIIRSEKMYKTTKILTYIPRALTKKSGLSTHDALRKVLREHVPGNSFEGLQKPFYLSVTNLRTGEYETISSGDSLDAWVAASASIPAVFESIHINGNMYIDGGVLNNMPAQPLAENCNFIIGINVIPYLPLDNYFDNTLDVLALTIRMTENQNSAPGKALCNHIIDVQAITKFNEFSFGSYDLIYQYGYDAVEKYISEHPEILDFKNKK